MNDGEILTWQQLLKLKEKARVQKKNISKEVISKNKNLSDAKKNKNDEFYTQLTDIEKELKHYKKHFKDKVVFLNCDDPQESNFWKYFELNFEELGLKRLVATHFDREQPTYKLELFADINGDGRVNKGDIVKTPLKTNGDFRSPECIEILKESDIVVTNPPFSLFREFIAQLIEYGKKFLIVGPDGAVTYKETFRWIKESVLWRGNCAVKDFVTPSGNIQKFGNIGWFTNLEHSKRNESMILYKVYSGNESDYPKYDNYNAIEISKLVDIPIDYNGLMGVPLTFLDKYNKDQFDIIGCNAYNDKSYFGIGGLYVLGKKVYSRILIKRK